MTCDCQSAPLQSPWPYKGRVKAKSFLYEIVANKRNGMDVDKWDYFARDCHHLGIGSTFDHRRYMAFARVLKVEKEDQALWPGTKQICAREKDASNLYDMFYVRKILHQRAYQHKTGNAVELMVRDILVLANDHIIITGSEEKKSISGCIKDMTAYTKLNDSILDIIKADPRPELAAARELIHRLECRRLYKYIGQTSPIEMGSPSYRRSGAEKMAEEILTHTRKEGERHFKPEDVLVHVVTFDYGSREGNPVDKMRFYSKANPYHAFKLKEAHVSKMLPSRFSEKFVRLYCKKEASSQLEYEALRRGFQAWCEVKSLVVEVDGDFPSTPYTSSSQRKAEQPDKPNSGRNTVAKALFK